MSEQQEILQQYCFVITHIDVGITLILLWNVLTILLRSVASIHRSKGGGRNYLFTVFIYLRQIKYFEINPKGGGFRPFAPPPIDATAL